MTIEAGGDVNIVTNLIVDTVITDNISSSDFAVNDGTRDRILAGTFASYVYSPDGTARIQIFDTSLGMVNGAVVQVEAGDFGTHLRSPDGTSTVLLVNDTYVEITGDLDISGYVNAENYIVSRGKLQCTGTDDGDILLQFETPRRWAFQQEGSGSAAALRLRNLLGQNKNFSIDTDGYTRWRSVDGITSRMSINHANGNLWAGGS